MDERDYRTVLGHFGSGVVVVTGVDEAGPAGLTCQSFFALSLAPPLIALAPSVQSRSWRRIASSGAFAINILSAAQRRLCLTFGQGGARDKFAVTGWDPALSGSPLIHGALGWLDCRIEAVHPGGDHHLVVGRVEDLKARPGEPLLFYRSAYATINGQQTPGTASRHSAWTPEDVWGPGLWQEGLDW
jgi:3-hydroxy-9,10-secoandrosta-1,3,5(10)-triene-9,17-dione monooxygenase reductase component